MPQQKYIYCLCGTMLELSVQSAGDTEMKFYLALAASALMSNWLVVPMFFHRTSQDGFFIGLIAAVIILIVGAITRRHA